MAQILKKTTEKKMMSQHQMMEKTLWAMPGLEIMCEIVFAEKANKPRKVVKKERQKLTKPSSEKMKQTGTKKYKCLIRENIEKIAKSRQSIRAVSPEPSLFAHITYGSRRRV